MSSAIPHLHRFFGLKPQGIIHVGASVGQEVEEFKQSGIRPVILIEPLPDAFRLLSDKVAGEAGFYPVQACCSSVSDRVVDFHVSSGGGLSSSYLLPKSHLTIAPQVRFDKTIRINTITLDKLIAETANSHNIDRDRLDYLAIDTQGAERDVLIGASELLKTLKFVWIEVTFGGLYENDDDVYTMIKFMRTHGFDLYHLMIGKNSWGDALFIREGILARGQPGRPDQMPGRNGDGGEPDRIRNSETLAG